MVVGEGDEEYNVIKTFLVDFLDSQKALKSMEVCTGDGKTTLVLDWYTTLDGKIKRILYGLSPARSSYPLFYSHASIDLYKEALFFSPITRSLNNCFKNCLPISNKSPTKSQISNHGTKYQGCQRQPLLPIDFDKVVPALLHQLFRLVGK